MLSVRHALTLFEVACLPTFLFSFLCSTALSVYPPSKSSPISRSLLRCNLRVYLRRSKQSPGSKVLALNANNQVRVLIIAITSLTNLSGAISGVVSYQLRLGNVSHYARGQLIVYTIILHRCDCVTIILAKFAFFSPLRDVRHFHDLITTSAELR